MWKMTLVLLLLALAVAPAAAQNSCADPFAGAGTLNFSTRYWTLTDFCTHSVPYDEIRSGGPPPDGIPPLDAPAFESIAAADEWLQPQSPVIALEIDGDARAYPLAILTWHEIANDTVGGVPVAVTFCPLCQSAIVYDRRVGDEVLRFGVSGNLRGSDMIMWDDKTESWWQQLTGEGIVGFYTGTVLTPVSSLVVGFGDFAAQYPDGQVLSRETGYTRGYGTNPYQGYDSSTRPFLFDGTLDTRLPAMAHVLGVLVNDVAVAYPFDVLAALGVINDTIDGVPVAAFWQDGVASALDDYRIDDSRLIGTAALYNRTPDDGRVLTFVRADDGTLQDAETGSTWNVFGTATAGELAGTALFREVGGPFFWFAWAAFRPETTIYGQ